jgi:hypothetical protein
VVVKLVPDPEAGLPPTAVHVNVYGDVPPVAEAVKVTGELTVPVVGPLIVGTGGVEEIEMVASLNAFAPLLSVTVAFTV